MRRFAAGFVLALAACTDAPPAGDAAAPAADTAGVSDPARLHAEAIVVDGHVDTPMWMLDDGYALGERHAPRADRAHVDLPRMAEGGLDAAFFSIYVAHSYGEGPAATARARALIDEVRRQVEARPGAGIARTAADVRRLAGAGRAAVLLGIEGGHALQGSPDVLREFAGDGVRYVTLTHSRSNGLADAATDAPRWGGLSPAGRAIVAEMNRRGVVVDLSHTSDSTFFDAVALSRAPVVLSHSSCRAVYDHPRNASDAMLRALAAAGGVVMINAYADYLGPGAITLDTFLDHVDHAVRVAGPDHVGIGSDFDGVPRLPSGLDDVTRLPAVTAGLLARGHRPETVRKILGGNVLRVLARAERVAAGLEADGAPAPRALREGRVTDSGRPRR